MKKILYYLGKVPAMGNDVDGGSILSKQLIDTLKEVSELDVIFRRTSEAYYTDDKIRNIEYIEEKQESDNKFCQRVMQSKLNRLALKEYKKYDVVIVQHASLLFGTAEFGDEFWNKTILFPMFLTHSYEKSNETIPQDYIQEENDVMNMVKHIITPSILEKEQILKLYKGDKNITVLPRGITKHIKFLPKETVTSCLNLTNIGSIKKQKNQMDSLRVLKYLIEHGIDARLQLITTVQDKEYFSILNEYITENRLGDRVKFSYSLSQAEVAEQLISTDFNISTSNWETFGRGIYEGVCAGKVTFILESLEEVTRFIGDNKGIVVCSDWLDMANRIIDLVNNYGAEIELRREDLKELAGAVSYDHESQRLKEIILSV